MLIILVGPSGSGKSTIERILETKHGFARIVSHTTRPPRPQEIDGVDYYFVSEEEFLATPMAEQTLYDGHFYGVSVQELESKSAQSNVVIVCEPNGVRAIKSIIPEAITILLSVPPAVCRYRMIYDRKMTREEAEQRLRLDNQVFKDFKADYVVPNSGAIETAIRQILNIVQPEILPLENVPDEDRLFLSRVIRETAGKRKPSNVKIMPEEDGYRLEITYEPSIRRLRRITGYLAPIERFNQAKKAELFDRVSHFRE